MEREKFLTHVLGVERLFRIEYPVGGMFEVFGDSAAFLFIADALINDPSRHVANVDRVDDDWILVTCSFTRRLEDDFAGSFTREITARGKFCTDQALLTVRDNNR